MSIFRYLFILGLFMFSLCAQGINSISQIREQFKRINSNIATYIKNRIEIDGISSEGAVANVYKNSVGSIELIKLNVFGEMGKSEEDYYFYDNKLIFVYQVDYTYNAPMYAEDIFDEKKTKISRNRFYFINQKMVKWLNNKLEQVPSRSKKFKNREKSILSFIEKNFKFIKNSANKNSNKALFWNKIIGGKGDEALLKSIQTKDGGYLIATGALSSKKEITKIAFLKFGSDGSLKWKYLPKYGDYNKLYNMFEEQDNSIVICRTMDIEGNEKALIYKLLPNGKVLWSKKIEKAEPGVIENFSCIHDENGYIIYGDLTQGGTGKSYFWIKHLDSKANILWLSHFKKSPNEETIKVLKTKDKGLIAIGYRDKESQTNLWAIKLSKSGKRVWQKYFGEIDTSKKLNIKSLKNGNILILQEGNGSKRGQEIIKIRP